VGEDMIQLQFSFIYLHILISTVLSHSVYKARFELVALFSPPEMPTLINYIKILK